MANAINALTNKVSEQTNLLKDLKSVRKKKKILMKDS
jgi:hypothetical protein